MSAQPVEPLLPGQVQRVPRTIRGISDWLTEEKRAKFLEQVMAAKEEDDYNQVMDNWWAEAHLDQDPYREERRRWAMTADRSELVSIDELKRRWFPEENEA
ncbi:hypothetical protein E1264_39915 [Actinomadura sp. KC216]|uniref:hypothetical protein n=1 Tax=Actinomadura sp. KC216 TaxID=2530370 RepID=UPI00104BF86A|nr:hypothetical protein [Actinomadura sp. KC216]TDB75390.1 hypothetical protein E1264_39915 [Actinomadura sp. KC216]